MAHHTGDLRLQQDVKRQAIEVPTGHRAAEGRRPRYKIRPQIAHDGH